MCKSSLMRRLKSHRLLLTQLQIVVAESHLILQSFLFPVETAPGFIPLGHHTACEEGKLQTELLDMFLASVVLFQLGHSFWSLHFSLGRC